MEPQEYHLSEEFNPEELFRLYDEYADYQEYILQNRYYAEAECLSHYSEVEDHVYLHL